MQSMNIEALSFAVAFARYNFLFAYLLVVLEDKTIEIGFTYLLALILSVYKHHSIWLV